MADVSNLRANINGVFETFGVKDKIARENTENLSNALFAAQIVDSASGAIASFSDGADDVPVRSLSVDLEPIQDLHGQDSPYPAGGGKNKYGGIDTILNGYISASGAISGSADNRTVICSVKPSTTYTVSFTRSIINLNDDWQIGEYADIPAIGSTGTRSYSGTMSNTGVTSATVTTGATANYIAIKIANITKTDFDSTKATLQVEEGSTVTAYAPYSNICLITGRESVTVWRTGKNMWDEEWEYGLLNTNGSVGESATRITTKNFVPVIPGESYCMRITMGGRGRGAFYADDKTLLAYYSDFPKTQTPDVFPNNGAITAIGDAWYFTFIAPPGAKWMKYTLYPNATPDGISINYPSTDHDYHSYDGQQVTVQLGQTVYGGTLDVVSGKLTVDRAMVDLGTLNWNRVIQSGQQVFTSNLPDALVPASSSEATTAVCSALKTVSTNKLLTSENACIGIGRYLSNVANLNAKLNSVSTKEDFKAAMSGIQLCYPLATPLEITLDPATLSTLKGDNNVWSDGDSVTVDYVADPKLYIDSLTEPDSDMVADTNIVSGKYFTINNVLYLATANIANGAAIVPGTNCTKTNLAEALNAINA